MTRRMNSNKPHTHTHTYIDVTQIGTESSGEEYTMGKEYCREGGGALGSKGEDMRHTHTYIHTYRERQREREREHKDPHTGTHHSGMASAGGRGTARCSHWFPRHVEGLTPVATFGAGPLTCRRRAGHVREVSVAEKEILGAVVPPVDQEYLFFYFAHAVSAARRRG